MNAQTKRILKAKLRQYPSMRDRIAEKFADIASQKSVSHVGVGSGESHIDCMIACDTLMDSKAYLWVKAIENTLKDYEGDTAKIIRMRYFQTHRASDYDIETALHYSRRRIYDKEDDFLNQLHKYTIAYRLLGVQ